MAPNSIPRRDEGKIGATMATQPILIVVGTNRPGANALRIGKIIQGIYQKAGETVDLYGLDQMPREIFDASSYAAKPAGWEKVQQRVVEAKGLHIVTPEYNGGFPGVLKYFIDMLKFPESFEHKPVAFVGEAHGMWGALRPVEQLAAIFSYRNAYLYPERVFIPRVDTVLDGQGKLTDEKIEGLLEKQARGFARFAGRVGAC